MDNSEEKVLAQIRSRIREARFVKGWTYENMAMEIGVCTATYYKIENGKSKITLRRFLSICNSLNLNPKDLVDFDKKSTKATSDNVNYFHLYKEKEDTIQRLLGLLEAQMESNQNNIT
jgi:transcriptional regulator with XRE-family HTH domain